MIRAVAVVASLLAFTASSTARANDPGSVRPGRALFERAEANFNRGKFEEARADYQAAYDVEPLPAFLFNIGQCYRNMGDYEHALFFFHRYTVLDPRSPNRGAAERLIAEMNRLADERRSREGGVSMAANIVTPAPALAGQADRSAGTSLLGPTVQTTAGPAPAPLYRRPWFWVAVGGTVVLGAAAAAIALSHDSAASGTLPSIDAR